MLLEGVLRLAASALNDKKRRWAQGVTPSVDLRGKGEPI